MSQEKQSKVVAVQHHDKQDNYGNWSHTVTMENDDSGYCNTKDKEASYFAKDSVVKYTIEERTSKAGDKTYNIIKRPSIGFQGAMPKKAKSVKDYKFEAVFNAANLAQSSIAVDDDLSMADFPKYFKTYLKYLFEAIEGVDAEQ